MRALILAAGMGSRLGPLGRRTPKPLVEVGREPLLFRLVRQCAAAGCDRIHVVVGHAAAEVRAAVLAGVLDVDVDFVYNSDFASTNNIVSLRAGLQHVRDSGFEGDLLLAECDVVVADTVLERLAATPSADVAVVSPFRPGMDGTVVRLEGAAIREVVTTARQGPYFRFDGTFKTVNLYKLSHRLWSSKLARLLDWYIEEESNAAYYENAIGMIAYASGDALSSLVIRQSDWHEVDDPNDLRIARAKVSPAALAHELDRGKGGLWDFDVLDFTYLRNTHFPPTALVAQLRERLEDALHHYGSSQQVLDDKMSWLLETDARHTVALAGLSAVYPLLTTRLDTAGTWLPRPSFGEYAGRYHTAQRYDATAALRDVEALVTARHASDVVVVNPNNPTGTLHHSRELVEIALRQPACTFWVDESFLAFTDEPSLRAFDDTPPNVVVLSSLSKSLGVPGLRLGYVWSRDEDLLDQLRRQLPIWPMASLAEIFLTLAMKFRADYLQSLRATVIDKADLESRLAGVEGVRVVPGVHGNFVLVELSAVGSSQETDIVSELLVHGILAKAVGSRLASPSAVLRVAVRSADDHRRLVAALAATLERLSSEPPR